MSVRTGDDIPSIQESIAQAVSIAALDGCENVRLAMWQLIDAFENGVHAVESGRGIRNTNVTSSPP